MGRASDFLKILEGNLLVVSLSGDAMANLDRGMIADGGTQAGDELFVGRKRLGGHYEFHLSQRELDRFLEKNGLETTLKKGDIAIVEKDDFEDVWGKVSSGK